MKALDIAVEKIEALRGRAADFFLKKNTKPFVFAVLALLLVFAVSGIIAVAAGSGTEKKDAKRPAVIQENTTLKFLHPLLPPKESQPLTQSFSESQSGGDYRLFRPRTKKWDAREAEQWFAPPDTVMLEQLHNSNNALIQSVLEGAP